MLSSILMESAGITSAPDVSADMLAKYGYNSEHRIAMESAAELNDIFYESFYQMEELDFMHTYATMEGASEVTLEGVVSNIKEKGRAAIAKIKKFLNDLWTKVKAFFHNVKRFLDGIFMNAQDFVKKYEKELNALTFEKNTYEVELYDYDEKMFSEMSNIVADVAKNVSSSSSDGTKTVEDYQKYAASFGRKAQLNDNISKDTGYSPEIREDAKKKYQDAKDTLEKLTETSEKQVDEDFISRYGKYGLKADFSSSDLAQAVWSALRSGASDSNDKKRVVVKKLDTYISYLKTSRTKLSDFDKAAKHIDTMFKQALANVAAAERNLSKEVSDSFEKAMNEMAVTVCRATSTSISRYQGYMNVIVANTRAALQEKISAYKKVCTGAFSHADKKDKDKK